ncbi:MAG TPA: transcription elongation factor GreB [Polyangiaceae bacterium]|nr:transcription elongation factor GreB [Polyangiaceae bacterium]
MPDPNYITPEGAKKLSRELDQLKTRERPKVVDEVATAAAEGDRSENGSYIYGKKRLREIDRRIRFLTKRLEAARVITETHDGESVFFGAWVTVEDEEGARREYRIVGEDEVDPSQGRISWRSPLGRALLKKTAGDVVTVQRPAGAIDFTLIAVRYAATS